MKRLALSALTRCIAGRCSPACPPRSLLVLPATAAAGQQQRDVAPARDEPRSRPARARRAALRHATCSAPRAHTAARCSHRTPSATARSGAGCSSSTSPDHIAGENLAWGTGSRGTARGIVAAWLASPEHRANLLRPSFARVGIGDLAARSWATAARTSSPPTSPAERRPSEGGLALLLALEEPRAARLSFSRRSSSRSPRLDPREQVTHERRQLDRVERLRHVVDAAEVDAAGAVAQLGARGQEHDRDVLGARRRRAAPPRPASRRGPASSRRAGSRPASRRAPSRDRSARRPPRAPPCPLPRG